MPDDKARTRLRHRCHVPIIHAIGNFLGGQHGFQASSLYPPASVTKMRALVGSGSIF